VPDEWAGPTKISPHADACSNYVATVQRFGPGGFEVTVKDLDLAKLGRMQQAARKAGKREQRTGGVEDAYRAAARARAVLRHKVREIGAQYLWTFTFRETEETGFRTLAEVAEVWARFQRMAQRMIGRFDYVAVPEKHKKGNYHLHVAIRTRLNVNQVRAAWWSACGGRGQGNVDARWIKVPGGQPTKRADRVARYISKYIAKSFLEQADANFNKKRYWATKIELSAKDRVVLRAQTVAEALAEVSGVFGLNVAAMMGERQIFVFPGGGGFWCNYIPEDQGADPPF